MRTKDAYRSCEEITGNQARNFSYGIRLLPGPKRKAMSALYAMARRIDDVGDGMMTDADKLAALGVIRKDISAIGADTSRGETSRADTSRGDTVWADDDPVLVALHDSAGRYPDLDLRVLEELVDGCEADVEGTTYATFEDLVGYCRRVAGSVGRLSLGIFGVEDMDRALPLADSLGVALQLTNILRDIVEDRESMGRVYLPTEDLDRFGVRPDLSGPFEGLVALMVFEAVRAEDWYHKGAELLPLLDRRSRACTAAMAGIYRRLLERIVRDPPAVLQGRMSLPVLEKVWVASHSLIRGEL